MMDYFTYIQSKLDNQYGNTLSKEIINNFSSPRVLTIRINTLKSNFNEVSSFLNQEKIPFFLCEGIKDALILDCTKKEIENTNLYQKGKIYLQSLSSMLPPIIMNPQKEDHVLDMCAAPGSKTSQIAALTGNESCITAVEFHPLRMERLKFNLEKLGVKRITTLLMDARNLDSYYRFDKILLDAPCSGSGVIRWGDSNFKISDEYLQKCQKKQIALLQKALKILKPKGEIIYSTCSILSEENEDVLNYFLKKNEIELLPINLNEIEYLEKLPSKLNNIYLIKPNKYFEGFFVAKIRKIQ